MSSIEALFSGKRRKHPAVIASKKQTASKCGQLVYRGLRPWSQSSQKKTYLWELR